MKPGDSGFCIATFDSETEYQTELPNSTFLKYQESVGKANVQKKTPMSTKKRPAALLSTAAGSEAPASGVLHLQANTEEYQVMFYKQHNAWAIRERGGSKKQICSIPVKDRTPQQMLSVVKEAIQRLTSGEDKDSVKARACA